MSKGHIIAMSLFKECTKSLGSKLGGLLTLLPGQSRAEDYSIWPSMVLAYSEVSIPGSVVFLNFAQKPQGGCGRCGMWNEEADALLASGCRNVSHWLWDLSPGTELP